VPFAEQQQFFIDLAVRLTPPDLLAIECRASRVSLASSRAPRVEFTADGIARNVRQGGNITRSRISLDRNGLTFTSSGGNDDLNFNFTPLDGGRQLRVTRRISARELIEPVIIRTIYNKIDDVARWDLFDAAQAAGQTRAQNTPEVAPDRTARPRPVPARNNEAENLRGALTRLIEATNRGNIERQMDFYMPLLKAYYLARNAPLNLVRAEKKRTFAAARLIDIRAAEPEIIFQNGGREAIMRFRKKYQIQKAAGSRSGEVVQELRWQQSNGGWRIFSERDIKVIR
jgi:hypothetical protein